MMPRYFLYKPSTLFPDQAMFNWIISQFLKRQLGKWLEHRDHRLYDFKSKIVDANILSLESLLFTNTVCYLTEIHKPKSLIKV